MDKRHDHKVPQSWFFARLLYMTALQRSERRMKVDEDLWLIPAVDAESARRDLIAGASAATRVGRALAGYLPGELEIGGLRHLIESSFATRPTHRDQGLRESQSISELRPRVGRSNYEFLGLQNFHRVGRRLVSGTVVDWVELDPLLRGSAVSLGEKSLMAFDPAGPAYADGARSERNEYLFKRYRWYLADQLFEIPENEEDHASQHISPSVRLVLIRAQTPEEAYQKSVANGKDPHRASRSKESWPKVFHHLRELSLVTDRFRQACVLRTNEYSISTKNIPQFRAQGH